MAKQILIIIVCLILGALIGFSIGALVLKQPTTVLQPDNITKLAEALRSKTIMVSSAIATGKIANISGKTLTIATTEGQSLDIPIREDAQIGFIVPSVNAGNVPTVKTIEFKDIKTGDNVYINLELLPDGSFQGSSLTTYTNS